VVEQRHQFVRLVQGNLVDARLTGGAFDVLQHAVQDGACEIRLGVGQPRLVVGAGRLGEGQESLAFQVVHQRRPLPCGTALHKVPGEDFDQ
jgi:hypothetical protein